MSAPRWLPGVVTMPSSHDAGTMLGQDAYFTWHTYEAGYSLTATDGARRLIAAGNEVHFCFNPVSGGLVQILPADRAARGLVNLTGGVQTNRQGRVNLQVEVIAYAKRPWTQDITDAGRATLAKLVDFADAHGIPRTHPNGDQGPLTASGPFNRSVTGWAGPGGHFCHGQVPENTHWDHGPVRVSDLWAIADTINHPPEDDMAVITEDNAREIFTKYAIMKDYRAADPETAPRVTPSNVIEYAAQMAEEAAKHAVITDEQLERVLRKVLGSLDEPDVPA